MPIIACLLFIEAVICNVVFHPTEQTDVSTAMYIMLLINASVLIMALARATKDKKVNFWIACSFLLRLFVLFWDIYARHIFILPNSEGDAVWYHRQALSYAFGSRVNVVNLKHFPFYAGAVYKLIGSQKMTIQFINIYLAICSVVIVYRILTLIEVSPMLKRNTIIILSFLPNSLMITTFFLQESFVSFMIITSAYMFTLWWKKRNPIYYLLALAISIYSALLHIGGIVCAAGFLILYFLIKNKERTIRMTPSNIVTLVIMLFVSLFAISMFGDQFLNKLGGELSAESITSSRVLTEKAGGQYYVGIPGLPAMLDLIVNTPIRMLYFIFSPLPWMWRGPGDIVAFFGSTIFYIATTISAWKTIKDVRRNRYTSSLWSYMFVILIVILIAAFMFGWGVSNSGSALRHREKFTYLCTVLFAISIEIKMRIKQRNHQECPPNIIREPKFEKRGTRVRDDDVDVQRNIFADLETVLDHTGNTTTVDELRSKIKKICKNILDRHAR